MLIVMPRLRDWFQVLECLDLVSYEIERSMAEGKFVGRLVKNTNHVPADGQAQGGIHNDAYRQE